MIGFLVAMMVLINKAILSDSDKRHLKSSNLHYYFHQVTSNPMTDKNPSGFHRLSDTLRHLIVRSNPVGQIILFAGNTAPEGWLTCDGAMVSTLKYSALAKVLKVENSSSFQVPQLEAPKGTSYIIFIG
jgi:hypothetical protein